MKKIVTTLALTLCAMHDCSAMFNPIRQNIGRFGQYARQYAQQAAPTTCRTFASRASRPQNFGWVRNLPTYARNVNLPSMRTAALGLGGLGLGTAAYLQRPELFARVQAEEQEEHSIFDEIELKLKSLAANKGISDLQWELKDLETKLYVLTVKNKIVDRKKFASIVNNLLTMANEDLYRRLQVATKISCNNTEGGASMFLMSTFYHDVALVNAVDDLADLPSNVELEIPDVYKAFFQKVGKNNELKQHFINAIDKLNKKWNISLQKLNTATYVDDADLSHERRLQNSSKLLQKISDILESASS